MPSLSRKQPDKDAIYVCVQSYAWAGSPDGGPVSVRAGSRRRGSDPLVRGAPGLWVLDGATDDEIALARQGKAAMVAAPYPSEPPPKTGYGDPNRPDPE